MAILKRIGLVATLSLVALAVIIIFWNKHPSPTYLIVGIDNSWENGGPVSVLNLMTEASTTIAFNAAGCDGFLYERKTKTVVTNCRFGTEQNIFYNVFENTFIKNTLLPDTSSLRAPLACDSRQNCYFGKGNFIDEEGTASAHIYHTKDGALQSDTQIPGNFGKVIPSRYIKKGDTLFMLGVTAFGTSSRVLVLDTKSNKIEVFTSIDSDTWDLDVSEKFVALSVNRRTTGKDVYIYNREDATLAHSLAISGNEHTFNALGVKIVKETLYVAGGQGVHAYSLRNFTEIAFFKTNAFAAELAHGNNRLYATVPNESIIYELELGSLIKLREFKKNLGFGRIYVAE